MSLSRNAHGLPLLLRAAALVLMLPASAPHAQERAFTPPATPGQPVVETLHGVTLTDQYPLAGERQGPGGGGLDAGAARRDARAFLDRERAAGAGPARRAHADHRPRPHVARRTSATGREFFQRTLKGEPQAKLYTTDATAATCCCSIRWRSTPRGKTTIGAVMPNRDGSLVAVGTYLKGSEILEFRILDSRTGAQQVGAARRRLGDSAWARDERYATSRRAPPRPMRSRSRAAATATGWAATARTTSC